MYVIVQFSLIRLSFFLFSYFYFHSFQFHILVTLSHIIAVDNNCSCSYNDNHSMCFLDELIIAVDNSCSYIHV